MCVWETGACSYSSALGCGHDCRQHQAALGIQAGGNPKDHAPNEGVPCSSGVHNGLLQMRQTQYMGLLHGTDSQPWTLLTHLLCQEPRRDILCILQCRLSIGLTLRKAPNASQSQYARATVTFAMPAAVATATEACRLCSSEEGASWLK